MSPAAARWSAIVARSEHSRLSLRQFAAREGVNPNTLAWWRWNLRRREREQQGDCGFAEVLLVEDSPTPEGLSVEVGNARIRVTDSSNLCLLRAVVDVLA